MHLQSFSKLILAVASVVCFAPAVAGGPPHVLGGSISWRVLRPGETEGTPVLISVRLGLKRSLYTGTAADGKPAAGEFIFEPRAPNATTLNFGDGATETELSFRVEAIDPTDDWMLVRASFFHDYLDNGPYTARLIGCCSPNPTLSISTTIQFDVGRSSPATTLPPVIHCVVSNAGGQPCFQVLGGSEDVTRILRYRLATQSESGFSTPPGVSINSQTGAVTVNQTGAEASVQVMMELFNAQDGSPIGPAVVGSAVEFRLRTLAGVPLNPVFLAPNSVTPANGLDLACGTSAGLTPNQNYQHPFRPYSFQTPLELNIVGVPAAGIVGTPVPQTFNGGVTNLLSFTPSGEDEGVHVVTAIVTSRAFPTTQRLCSISLNVFTDSDRDNIPDVWERSGYFGSNGNFVNLPAMGAKPDHKDIFVYVNSYTDPLTLNRSLLSKAAIDKVIQAFASAPIYNDDGKTGIALHVVYGDLLIPYVSADGPLSPIGGLSFNWTRFDSIKAARFPLAYRPVFRYGLFFPTQGGPSPSSTGIARGIPSNDFAVTLGAISRTFRTVAIGGGKFRAIPESYGGSDENQAGTFMHELGHAFGLAHGGPEVIADPVQKPLTYKPNYFSVMNYAYQLNGIPTNGSSAVFDYSQYSGSDILTLNETNINETNGFGVVSPLPPTYFDELAPRRSAIERNLQGVWYCQTNNTRRVACRDANGVLIPGCNLNSAISFSCGPPPFLSSVATTLRQSAALGVYQANESYADWSNLNYKGGVNGGGVVGLDPVETTPTDVYNPEVDLKITPNPPTGVSARRTALSVRLAWNALGNVNTYVYAVYKKVGAAGTFNLLTTTTAATINDAVAAGQTVFYYVNATNGAEVTSANSTTISVVVP